MHMDQVWIKAMIQDSFYEELEQVFCHCLQQLTIILLGDFNVEEGREDIFKPTIGNDSLHQDRNDIGVSIVNFATSNILVVKSMMFTQRNIDEYTWTSPDEKTHNQIDHILLDRSWKSSILDV